MADIRFSGCGLLMMAGSNTLPLVSHAQFWQGTDGMDGLQRGILKRIAMNMSGSNTSANMVYLAVKAKQNFEHEQLNSPGIVQVIALNRRPCAVSMREAELVGIMRPRGCKVCTDCMFSGADIFAAVQYWLREDK